jgi:hypothetical protein
MTAIAPGARRFRTAAGWIAPVVGWTLFEWEAVRVGRPLRHLVHVDAFPVYGSPGRHVSWAILPVAAFGVALACGLPRGARQLPWRRLLAVALLLGLAWGLAVALLRGPERISASQRSQFEYPAVVHEVDRIGVGELVRTFTEKEQLRRYPIHVQGHPLGAALLFVGLDRVGMGGAAGATVFLLAVGSTTTLAVLVTVREVAGESAARAAAPFLVLAPAVVWAVTSADALFAAVGAWATALVVLATRSDCTMRRRGVLGVSGGLLFGIGVNLSYGLAPLVIIPVSVVVARRRWDVLGMAAAGGAAVVGAFAGIGFWWFDGLAATHGRYLAGVSRRRPFHLFTYLGNPAAFGLAVGPAASVAVTRARGRGVWLLGGAALAAVAVSDLAGLSKGEVERIWLPFVPWVLALAGGIGFRRLAGEATDRRADATVTYPIHALLVAQVATAIAVESFVLTLW